MNKKLNRFLVVLLIASFCAFPMVGMNGSVRAQGAIPPKLVPSISADGLTLYNGIPPLVVLADPNPAMQGLKATGPTADDVLADPEAAYSTFSFTYVAAGGSDPWGQTCQAFPAAAKTAFNAAGAIWASILKSTVPIKIEACWANLGSPSILGYSGGEPQHRNFTGAPKSNTWYEATLANALHGSDLAPSDYDDYITYNSGFTWYYGTDGLPPAGTYDLVSVAAHEIGHGLNFAGMADYSSGSGSFGWDTGYPNIYDTFMENAGGTKLTSYTNPSTALGTLLTSNDLWFNGTNSKAANGGTRVKIYAPSSWAPGSSYSHLDYTTFVSTANNLMVYAISSGTARHVVGPVIKGMMKDMGWVLGSGTTTVPTPQSPSGAISTKTPTYKWTKVTGATSYRFQLVKGTTTVYTKTVASSVCGTSTCSSTPATTLTYAAYKWRVRAMIGGVWKSWSAYKSFTVPAVPTPQSPSGTISTKTPAYKWTKIAGATSYRFQLVKGTTTVYTKTVASSVCGTSTCSSTPTTTLTYAAYKWRVKAKTGGVWKSWSAYKNFTIAAPATKPEAGFWESTTADEFYVTPTQDNVVDFAIYITVSGCGSYKITNTALVPIVSKSFSFSGSFSGSGTFDTTTSAHGVDQLSSFSISGCGTVSGGPWSYTATWKNSNQPTIVVHEGAKSVIVLPLLQAPYFHNITVINR